jgi:hypothetical protein
MSKKQISTKYPEKQLNRYIYKMLYTNPNLNISKL